MAEERARRRLAAILAADVVGYSRLMQADEAGTVVALKARLQEIIQPLIAQHHGRVVKLMGDGVLVEFPSAVDAVTCAGELQDAMSTANASLTEERQIVLRVGINLGDVIVEGGDLYGDGVNIAARLESEAQPGSIVVSETVYSHVRGKVPHGFEDLGERSLKNMADPVRVYRVSGIAPSGALPSSSAGAHSRKPSIVVLPFTNMSGDPEQEYFSDGITEDIITDLSQVSALFVVARNTAFTFKDRAVEIVQAARKLNVAYALEGSVRKAGNRLRITAQLVDGVTGGYLWAERYDRDFGDVFALQDEIAKSVVTALKVKLLPEELATITKRTTLSAEAYQCYLQARSTWRAGTGSKRALRSAREMFSKAAEIDPGYARAYAGIADCDAMLWLLGDLDISYEEILANSGKALQLAPNLAEAHASKGLALGLNGRFDEATKAFERAIELDDGLFEAFMYYGRACRMSERLDKAEELLERAVQLGPDDYRSVTHLCEVLIVRGRREQALSVRKRILIPRLEAEMRRHPDNAEAAAIMATCAAETGEDAQAEDGAKRAIMLEPDSFGVRYNAACVFACVGKPDDALENLEYIFSRMPRMRHWLLGHIKTDSQIARLLGNPAFEAFMTRLQADVATNS